MAHPPLCSKLQAGQHMINNTQTPTTLIPMAKQATTTTMNPHMTDLHSLIKRAPQSDRTIPSPPRPTSTRKTPTLFSFNERC